MRVSVGYSEHPDTYAAGVQAAREALGQGVPGRQCDMVLLFATSQHDAHVLRRSVQSVVGKNIPIVGGAAVGAISNNKFGYAGDQIILAVFWYEKSKCLFVSQGGLADGEKVAGKYLGKKLAKLGVKKHTSTLLFYDAINRIKERIGLTMVTPFLEGLKEELGFLPNLAGAGLQGDFMGSPTCQWLEDKIANHHAFALAFSDDVRMDTAVMHGCKPGTGYYTVTKADQQTILEINNEPALEFMDKLFMSSISPEDYAFFLIFGVNKGKKWAEFQESDYVNCLCLTIDKERSGIVMFEPDMVAGTEFQIMYRNTYDLTYMAPRIEALFTGLEGRSPVLALYINCAGRAAGVSGVEFEDAVMVQETIAGRVPLLGVYTGVEIASVAGVPHGLDWTGVFCLLSVPNETI